MKIVYSSEGNRLGGKPGLHVRWRATSAKLNTSFILAWRLFIRDASAKYRQSVLGILWALMTPLFLVGILVLLNKSGIITFSERRIPYPVFAIVGISMWGIFATGMSIASECLKTAGRTMLKVNFPKTSLVLAASWMGLLEFVIRLPVIVAVTAYYVSRGDMQVELGGIITGILLLIPLYIFALALGFCLSVVGAVLQDVTYLLPIVLPALMLLSPILYPLSPETLLGKASLINPIGHFVESSRNVLLGIGSISEGYWISSLLAIALLALGFRFFRVTQRRLLERI